MPRRVANAHEFIHGIHMVLAKFEGIIAADPARAVEEQITEEQQQRLAQLFAAWDANSSGYLEAQELNRSVHCTFLRLASFLLRSHGASILPQC